VTAVRGLRDTIHATLAASLGEGEAVAAPSGRVWFLARVADGAACVNTTAVDEMAGELPPRLRRTRDRFTPASGMCAPRCVSGRSPAPKLRPC